MSKNLTNVQLNIITDRILIELRKKIITNKVFIETSDRVANELNYKVLKNKAKRYDDIQKEISLLQQEANILSTEIKNPFGQNIYFQPTLINFLNQYEKKIEKELSNLLPTSFEIQSDIVLNSINGSKDLINDIIKKYT